LDTSEGRPELVIAAVVASVLFWVLVVLLVLL
jgi:hypothetical protein